MRAASPDGGAAMQSASALSRPTECATCQFFSSRRSVPAPARPGAYAIRFADTDRRVRVAFDAGLLNGDVTRARKMPLSTNIQRHLVLIDRPNGHVPSPTSPLPTVRLHATVVTSCCCTQIAQHEHFTS